MKNLIFYIFLLAILCSYCNSKHKKIILISKDNNKTIEHWLLSIDPNLKIKECYYLKYDSIYYYIRKADGIVLGGGEDVNPRLYNKPEYVDICEVSDNFRDSLEMFLIAYSKKSKIPILGICRGNQILNVAYGGSLIPDIPSFKKNSKIIHRNTKDSAHLIFPALNSWISKNTNNKFWVNSKHHQCVDQLAYDFQIAAISEDSVIESIQLKDTINNAFTIGVQWHPEALNSPLSLKLGKLFLRNKKSK